MSTQPTTTTATATVRFTPTETETHCGMLARDAFDAATHSYTCGACAGIIENAARDAYATSTHGTVLDRWAGAGSALDYGVDAFVGLFADRAAYASSVILTMGVKALAEWRDSLGLADGETPDYAQAADDMSVTSNGTVTFIPDAVTGGVFVYDDNAA